MVSILESIKKIMSYRLLRRLIILSFIIYALSSIVIFFQITVSILILPSLLLHEGGHSVAISIMSGNKSVIIVPNLIDIDVSAGTYVFSNKSLNFENHQILLSVNAPQQKFSTFEMGFIALIGPVINIILMIAIIYHIDYQSFFKKIKRTPESLSFSQIFMFGTFWIQVIGIVQLFPGWGNGALDGLWIINSIGGRELVTSPLIKIIGEIGSFLLFNVLPPLSLIWCSLFWTLITLKVYVLFSKKVQNMFSKQ